MVRIAVWFGFSATDQNRIETMTIDRLHLAELIEKGSDADLLREMMIFTVNRMMDLDVEGLTGAAYGERSDARTNQRNGYRERPWHTTIGTLPVAIPKLRKGSYFPSFLEARRTSDKALIAVPPSGQKPSRLPDDPSRCRSDHGLCSYTTGWGTTLGVLLRGGRDRAHLAVVPLAAEPAEE